MFTIVYRELIANFRVPSLTASSSVSQSATVPALAELRKARCVVLFAFTVAVAPSSARAEQRIALVLGNAAYETGALKTTANDAGLIAQTLEAAGFEVIGARDLDMINNGNDQTK